MTADNTETGPCRTVGDLIARLSQYPADTPVLVDGYEGGFTTVTVSNAEVQELRGLPAFYGEFMSPDDGDFQVERAWRIAKDSVPPVRVGVPVTAVVLRR